MSKLRLDEAMTLTLLCHMGGQVREVEGPNLLTRGRHLPFGEARSLQKGLALFLVIQSRQTKAMGVVARKP